MVVFFRCLPFTPPSILNTSGVHPPLPCALAYFAPGEPPAGFPRPPLASLIADPWTPVLQLACSPTPWQSVFSGRAPFNPFFFSLETLRHFPFLTTLLLTCHTWSVLSHRFRTPVDCGLFLGAFAPSLPLVFSRGAVSIRSHPFLSSAWFNVLSSGPPLFSLVPTPNSCDCFFLACPLVIRVPVLPFFLVFAMVQRLELTHFPGFALFLILCCLRICTFIFLFPLQAHFTLFFVLFSGRWAFLNRRLLGVLYSFFPVDYQ